MKNKTTSSSVSVTQIRNATIHVAFGGVKFLIDPWLGPKGYMEGLPFAANPEVRQPRTELPMTVEDIIRVDAVIVTHLHYDHWDEYAENVIARDKKIFVQNGGDKGYLESKGYSDVEIISPDGTEYGGVCLHQVQGQHGRREDFEGIYRQLDMPYGAMGVVFSADGAPTLYVAGDTIWCREVEAAVETFCPQVIVLNACGASIPGCGLLIMGREDVAALAKFAAPSIIVASHMDTVSHMTVSRNDLKQYLEAQGVSNVLLPQDGETLTF